MRRSAADVILIASLLSFLLVGPALAEQFEDAMETYECGDYPSSGRGWLIWNLSAIISPIRRSSLTDKIPNN